MLRILLLSTLLNSCCAIGLSQVDIYLSFINPFEDEEIENVMVQYNGVSYYSNWNGSVVLRGMNIEHLEDTLKIIHPNYTFREQTLKQCVKSLHTDLDIEAEIVGIPSPKVHRIDLKIGYNPKPVNDSIVLMAYYPHEIDSIKLMTGAGFFVDNLYKFKKSYSGTSELYSCRISSRALLDGYFVLFNNWSTDTVSFDASKYFMGMDLRPEELRVKDESRFILWSKNHHKLINQLTHKYEIELKELRSQLDSMNLVIKKLKGIKTIVPIPDAPKAYPEEEIYMFVKEQATPKGGMESFLLNLSNEFKRRTAPECGNILLKVTVLKDGHLDIDIIKCNRLFKRMNKDIVSYIVQYDWKPASINGKKVNETIYLSINILSEWD